MASGSRKGGLFRVQDIVVSGCYSIGVSIKATIRVLGFRVSGFRA